MTDGTTTAGHVSLTKVGNLWVVTPTDKTTHVRRAFSVIVFAKGGKYEYFTYYLNIGCSTMTMTESVDFDSLNNQVYPLDTDLIGIYSYPSLTFNQDLSYCLPMIDVVDFQ